MSCVECVVLFDFIDWSLDELIDCLTGVFNIMVCFKKAKYFWLL